MSERAVIIGGGINGLVAANYLQRAGMQVTLLEKQPRLGGACASEVVAIGGKEYEYPTAATVLGFMQDFVFEQTGLSERLDVWAPEHPAVVWFASNNQPCLMYENVNQLRDEVSKKWGETGAVADYYADFERIVDFIRRQYRKAEVPALADATAELGHELTSRWISGTARNLLDHYFSSEPMKVFSSLDVTESGPVSLDEPYSAFTIPLMSTGTVFGGKWGFVKGGLWKLTEALAELNRELGVQSLLPVDITEIRDTPHGGKQILLNHEGQDKHLEADHLVFATDPLTAAKLLDDQQMIESVNQRKMLGTSGKLIMIFAKPVVWKDDSGLPDFDAAFKFIIENNTLESFESATQAVVDGTQPFAPGYFEIYCEGAGLRKLGTKRSFEYDTLSVFFKNIAFNVPGDQLDRIKTEVQRTVLSKIANPEDLVHSILLTPRDLRDRFFFPQGNIDHVELTQSQTFFDRTYSHSPTQNFYQFGATSNTYYCGAGTFPCGSIAGTPGYMCAQQLLTKSRRGAALQRPARC